MSGRSVLGPFLGYFNMSPFGGLNPEKPPLNTPIVKYIMSVRKTMHSKLKESPVVGTTHTHGTNQQIPADRCCECLQPLDQVVL